MCVCDTYTLTGFKTDVEMTIWSPPALAELSGWNLGCSSQRSVRPRISRPFSDINRTPWMFGKCCCINVQLEKPKHMKQSGLAQRRRTRGRMKCVSLSSLARPLDGDVPTRFVKNASIYENIFPSDFSRTCQWKRRHSSHWFHNESDLVWEGASWFSNRVWGAAFRRITHFEPSVFTKCSLSHVGKKYSRVVQSSQTSHSLVHKGALPLCKSQGTQRWPCLQQQFMQL